jgi:hypothetical protein
MLASNTLAQRAAESPLPIPIRVMTFAPQLLNQLVFVGFGSPAGILRGNAEHATKQTSTRGFASLALFRLAFTALDIAHRSQAASILGCT